MSSIHCLRCLFCKHLNPAGATFCSDCGGQLNLQPCEQCGAIDSRAARNCYKCGAEFSLPAAPEPDSLLAPAILGKELSSSTLNDAGAAGLEAAHPNHGLTYSSPEPQPVDEVLSPETAASATRSRRRTPVAILALLLVLAIAAVSVYLYDGQPVQLARKPGQKQAVTDVSSAPKLKPIDIVPKPATGTGEPEKAPSLAPPAADAAAAAAPLPTGNAEVKAGQDLTIVEKCPPAVATLGLCNPDTQQEKH